MLEFIECKYCVRVWRRLHKQVGRNV